MRFISNSARYQTCFRKDRVDHFASGESQIVQPLWNCEFRPDGWTAYERQVALGHFINRGMPTERDEVTVIDPTYRFGTFDTVVFQREHAGEGFGEKERLEMEAFLQGHYDYGSTFLMVDAPKLAPPWPTYDSFKGVRDRPTAQRIAERVREDGYDVALVLAYERENANRQDVIDALEAIGAAVPDEELVSA